MFALCVCVCVFLVYLSFCFCWGGGGGRPGRFLSNHHSDTTGLIGHDRVQVQGSGFKVQSLPVTLFAYSFLDTTKLQVNRVPGRVEALGS